MTRKYRVASSAMVSVIDGNLNPRDLEAIAQKTISENARKSGL